jgi:predicted Zn-dependent protease
LAKAGYDPAAAVTFWQMMEAPRRARPNPGLPLHPHADAERIANIERLIPWARQYFGPMTACGVSARSCVAHVHAAPD